MPPVPATLQPTTDKTTNTAGWQMLRRLWEQLARTVNGLISFGNGTQSDNIAGVWKAVTTPAANTDFTVTHNLQRACVGYLIMTKSAACDVYTSPTANADPNHTIILRATVNAVNLTMFLI
jgi:hypothetical protein